MKIEFESIGTIYTPFESLEKMPIQPTGAEQVEGKIVLKPEYEKGLKDVDGFSHLILIYLFHGSDGFNLEVVPFLDKQKRGLFSTRAPKRPNPVGLSVVKLEQVKGAELFITGIDVLNKTPLIDIKPYVPKFDVRPDAKAGWLEAAQKEAVSRKSDDRFV